MTEDATKARMSTRHQVMLFPVAKHSFVSVFDTSVLDPDFGSKIPLTTPDIAANKPTGST